MSRITERRDWVEIDEYAAEFEAALADDPGADLSDYLPAGDGPRRLEVLRELVRVDLEAGWDAGRPKPLAEYAARFPELLADRRSLSEVAFEEYRLRRAGGERVAAEEYARRYAIDVRDWMDVATGYEPPSEVEFPQVGSRFLDFRLLLELGRGVFGRVYLAEQGELANRLVAVKVSAELWDESRTLAQLQHTNIVPIYSVHRMGDLQAVCMPYFGSATLADVLGRLADDSSLPTSGRAFLDTVRDRKSATIRERRPGSKQEAVSDEAPADAADQPATEDRPAWKTLARLGYVEAVLWIAARLADGLSHAHERGIVHRDLKPANILIADDGQPMLLDFNLSTDSKAALALGSSVGGTLPYMAPEQLELLRGGRRTVDSRSDIYSLGVILFELLTGRRPFADRSGPWRTIVDELIADREPPAPTLDPCDRSVSPAVRSIVRRCLDPDPAARYRSAADLREDLKRHLADRPLAHAANPSPAELAAKWWRRHPRLRSAASIGTVAAVAVLALGGWLWIRGEQVAELRTQEAFRATRDELRWVRMVLTQPDFDARRTSEAEETRQRILDRYGVLGERDWRTHSLVARLEPADRALLMAEIGELLMATAREVADRSGRNESAATEGEHAIARALALNRLAEGCFPRDAVPSSIALQRADLLSRSPDGRDEALRLIESAESRGPRSAAEEYLLGADLLRRREFRRALGHLEAATSADPTQFAAWLLSGHCHLHLGNHAAARSCYTTCLALWPEAEWVWFDRGLAALGEGDYAAAIADFDRAAALKPNMAEAYANRGLAHLQAGDPEHAVADLGKAIELGAPATRLYFMRARARQQQGDAAGAQADLAEGLKRTPTDEASWIARGLARLAGDPHAALADFDEALTLNPQSRAALEDKAHVLSERLGLTTEAVAILDEVVELYPDYVLARAGRGVLLARLGRREAALADAQEAIRRDTRPANLYQVAGIYALTSQQAEADRLEAYRLLSLALRQGFGLDLVGVDPDLFPLRGRAEFEQLIEAAKTLQPIETTTQESKVN